MGRTTLNVKQTVLQAEERIRPYVRQTPLEPSFTLGQRTGRNVFLKLENLQFTGSFKLRGATNKILALSPEERACGVITASTGNHGLAVAHALQRLDVPGTICLPVRDVSPQKIDLLRRYPITLEFHGDECAQAEVHAREMARRRGMTYISPYNDPHVVAGQGTVAVEVLRQLDRVDAIFVAVGGGGLIGGIGGYLKEVTPETRVFGCLPENSPAMFESVTAGHIVDAPVLPTLSDGTSGGIETGAITFELCQRYVDEWDLVTEEEIAAGMRLLFEQHRLVVEGAAGVPVASFLRLQDRLAEEQRNVVIVVCGGNVDVETFKQIVCQDHLR